MEQELFQMGRFGMALYSGAVRTEECAEQAIFSRRRPVSTTRRAVAGKYRRWS
jgi:hypothetical protein